MYIAVKDIMNLCSVMRYQTGHTLHLFPQGYSSALLEEVTFLVNQVGGTI